MDGASICHGMVPHGRPWFALSVVVKLRILHLVPLKLPSSKMIRVTCAPNKEVLFWNLPFAPLDSAKVLAAVSLCSMVLGVLTLKLKESTFGGHGHGHAHSDEHGLGHEEVAHDESQLGCDTLW